MNKRYITILISLIFILFFKYITPPEGLNQSAMNVIGIFIGVLILWLIIAIDWPSMLALFALGMIPELGFNEVLKSSIGGNTFAFLLFTFLCTYAVSKTSFVKRLAIKFIDSKFAKKGPFSFVAFYSLSVLIIGLIMSPTVLYVIYLPILDEICKLLELDKKDNMANGLVIGQTISCSLSAGMTPIAHVFAIMAMGFYETATGQVISYGKYMMFAMPIGIICFVSMLLLFKIFLKFDNKNLKNLDISKLKDNSPMDKREKLILGIFLGVVILWVLPEFIKPIFPEFAKLISGKTTVFPPMLGAILMCIIEMDEKPLLNFNDGMKNGVSWASLIMTASTLAIGQALTNEEIGISNWLTQYITPTLNSMSPTVLVLIFTVWAAIQTNLSSNMVTVTLVSAVAIPICMSTNVNTAVISSMIGMMGAFAFATPPAHPNIALASASGWTTTGQMLRYGIAIMVISIAAVVIIGYPIFSKIM